MGGPRNGLRDRPNLPLRRGAVIDRSGQVQNLFLDVGGQVQQVHDLRDPLLSCHRSAGADMPICSPGQGWSRFRWHPAQLTKRARLGRESERFASKGHNRAAVGWSARGGQPRERGSFRGYWPFRAHGYCATVNQKAEKFALNKLGSANVPTSRPFSGDARWHQMAPPENFEDSDLSSFQSVTTSIMLNAVRLPLLEANKRRK